MAKNELLIKRLQGQATETTPIWLMRQAGRYLPEYKATRARAGSFMQLAQNPDLACEVTLQPIDRYGLDAAILFSDILTVPDAMGLGLAFVENEGPVFAKPLRDAADILALEVPDMHRLQYVFDAVKTIRTALADRVPLIGFAGSPYTIGCYMVEGRSSSDFRHIKTMMYSRPDLLHRILAVNAAATTAYLCAQIDAGAQVLMMFDTWGGNLSTTSYLEFSLAYMKQVVDGVRAHAPDIPLIVFTKNGGHWLEQMADLGIEALGLDWSTDIAKAKQRVGDRVVLQGNLDPSVLFGQPETIAKHAHDILESFDDGRGLIFNLGHGISQFTSPESVGVLVEAVHGYKNKVLMG